MVVVSVRGSTSLQTATFSVVANVDILVKTPNKNCQIQTKVQAHRSASFSPTTAKQFTHLENELKQSKNEITVLSDSQGKNIHPYIQNLLKIMKCLYSVRLEAD